MMDAVNSNELSRLASLVFGHGRAATLTAEEELALIRQVQAGDDDAFWTLCAGYVRALRSVMKGFHDEPTLGLQEAREELLQAFAEQVLTYDLSAPEKRLSYAVKNCKRSLTTLRDSRALPVHVPRVTMERFRSLKSKAAQHGWDERQTVDNAPTVSLSVATARQLSGHSRPVALEPGTHEPTEAEHYGPGLDDSDLVAIAFSAIADDQQATEVMQLKYGFDDPSISRRRTDGDIAEVLSCGPATIGRIHAKALSRMRVALGVEQAVLAA